MKVSDLYSSVAQLGFEDALEYEDGFIYSANRALLQVNALRPAESFCVINHQPLENKIPNASFLPVSVADELCYEASDAKSCYFETCGTGIVYIEYYNADSGEWDQIGIVEFDADGVFTPHRELIRRDGEFVNGLVRLRFQVTYLCTVRNVAMYGHLLGGEKADIPAYTPYTSYDISALGRNFLELASPPIVEEEGYRYLQSGYTVEDNRRILLPYDAKGVYKILYHRRPTPIDNTVEASENETEIDLDEDLCALLPLLISVIIWADDEPEKAEYYRSIYTERAAEVKQRAASAAMESPVQFRNINGW